jgi:acyl-CoA hydrolase
VLEEKIQEEAMSYIPEGLSCTKPPLFNGKNYYFWKGKMELFLKSQDVDMWKVITEGNFVPQSTDAVTAVVTIKPETSWTDTDKKKVLLNSKAQLFLQCSLTMEESERIYECNTAKEIWDTLKIHHEGTSHVKETRIDIGVRKFEIFEMNEEENIDEMYSRFTSIVNELRSLGKIYSPHDRIRKILRCLPTTWRPMVTAITQAKDLNSLALEDLIGTLRAHEVLLQEDKPIKKGKMIALKAAQENPDETSLQIEENKETEEEQTVQEEAETELALISKKIQRMMKRRDQIKRYFPNRKDNSKREVDKSQVTCYGCNKQGHYKNECPLTKRNQKSPFKKSALITWDDLEDSQAEEEGEANVCLMANSENEEVILFDTPSSKELENTIDNLLSDSNFLTNKCYSLQKEIKESKEEKEKLQTMNNDQKKIIQSLQDSYFQATEKLKDCSQTQNLLKTNENELLKKEVKNLRNDLTRFIKSTETFQKIIGSQVGIGDQTGVGFDTSKHQIYENTLIPKRIRCSFCKKDGHTESFCFHKQRIAENYALKKEHPFQNKEQSFIKCAYCKKSGHLDINCFLKKKDLEILKTNNEGPTESGVPKTPLTQNAGIITKCKEKAMVFRQWLL